MKPFVTAIGIVALLVGAANAYGAHAYTWVGGGGDTDWDNATNWYSGTGATYPGSGAAGDMATIADGTYTQVTVNSPISGDVEWVVVDAATANADLLLQITTNGVLRVCNASTSAYIRLVADPNDPNDATLHHAAGSLLVDDLDLRGGNDGGGEARAIFDVASDEDPNFPRLEIKGDIYLTGTAYLECNEEVHADSLRVGALTNAATAYKTGSSTLNVDTLIIEGSVAGSTVFTVSAGSLSVN